MKNFRLPRIYPILFVLLQTAMVLAPRVSGAASSIPFKATLSITETIQVIGTAPCFLVGTISGSGQATQLGKIGVASTDCINPISETTFSFFSSDQLVLTTASGEQIFANYGGTLSVQGQFGIISGGYVIVGGTGRYAHATGAGAVNGQEDMLTGKGQVQLFGTISY